MIGYLFEHQQFIGLWLVYGGGVFVGLYPRRWWTLTLGCLLFSLGIFVHDYNPPYIEPAQPFSQGVPT